jgi:hypothetical protein
VEDRLVERAGKEENDVREPELRVLVVEDCVQDSGDRSGDQDDDDRSTSRATTRRAQPA